MKPVTPMNRARGALPLRVRLTLLLAGVLAVALMLFGVILSLNLRRVLLDNAAQSLRLSAAAAISDKLSGPGPKPPRPAKGGPALPVPILTPAAPPAASTTADAKSLADLARFLTTRDTAARTLDTAGVTVGDGPALTGTTTVAAPLLDAATYRAVVVTGNDRYLRLDTAPDGPVLVELIPLTRPAASQTIGVLQLSASLRGVDDLLRAIQVALLIGTALALGVTVLLTAAIVRGVLRPLRQMAQTSHAVAAGDLTQRVAVPAADDELAELAQAFNTMVARLEAAFATQRRFLADASHELRSPLTALGGGVEMLRIGAAADSDARDRLLRLMTGEIARMGRLVDDLLTLARFDADPAQLLERAPTDLAPLARSVAEETRLLAPDRTVYFEDIAGQPVMVMGDADRLRQALLNLCTNARAHTPPGGTITIRVGRAGNAATVTVADTGEGIPPDTMPRVGERFYRVDPARPRDAGQGGLGLGLAIVRAITEAHGGSVTLTSAPGVGTTVTLAFPVLG